MELVPTKLDRADTKHFWHWTKFFGQRWPKTFLIFVLSFWCGPPANLGDTPRMPRLQRPKLYGLFSSVSQSLQCTSRIILNLRVTPGPRHYPEHCLWRFNLRTKKWFWVTLLSDVSAPAVQLPWDFHALEPLWVLVRVLGLTYASQCPSLNALLAIILDSTNSYPSNTSSSTSLPPYQVSGAGKLTKLDAPEIR